MRHGIRTLRTMYEGVDHVKEVWLQTLRCEFENLQMDDEQTMDDFAGKLNGLVNQIRVLGDNLDESVAVKSISGLFRRSSCRQ